MQTDGVHDQNHADDDGDGGARRLQTHESPPGLCRWGDPPPRAFAGEEKPPLRLPLGKAPRGNCRQGGPTWCRWGEPSRTLPLGRALPAVTAVESHTVPSNTSDFPVVCRFAQWCQQRHTLNSLFDLCSFFPTMVSLFGHGSVQCGRLRHALIVSSPSRRLIGVKAHGAAIVCGLASQPRTKTTVRWTTPLCVDCRPAARWLEPARRPGCLRGAVAGVRSCWSCHPTGWRDLTMG